MFAAFSGLASGSGNTNTTPQIEAERKASSAKRIARTEDLVRGVNVRPQI